MRHLSDDFDVTLYVWKSNQIPLDNFGLKTVSVISIGDILKEKHIASRILRRVAERAMDIAYAPGLEAHLMKEDIVFSAEPYSVWTRQALAAQRKANNTLVIQSYENLPFRRHSGAELRTKKESYRAAHRLVATTEQAKSVFLLEGAPEDKVQVIPPAVDVGKFAPTEKQIKLLQAFDVKQTDFVVLYLGRFLWCKGLLDVIEAASMARSTIKNLKVIIAGSGALEPMMREYIKAHDVEDLVKLIGRIEHNRTAELYNSADVVVAPSIPTDMWEEQFGLVLIEAMACGKPVITTRSGAIPEVVGPHGILVEPRDPRAVSERLIQIHDGRLGGQESCAAARTFIIEKYATKVVCDQLRQLFLECPIARR